MKTPPVKSGGVVPETEAPLLLRAQEAVQYYVLAPLDGETTYCMFWFNEPLQWSAVWQLRDRAASDSCCGGGLEFVWRPQLTTTAQPPDVKSGYLELLFCISYCKSCLQWVKMSHRDLHPSFGYFPSPHNVLCICHILLLCLSDCVSSSIASDHCLALDEVMALLYVKCMLHTKR